jgi:hypothetical protein
MVVDKKDFSSAQIYNTTNKNVYCPTERPIMIQELMTIIFFIVVFIHFFSDKEDEVNQSPENDANLQQSLKLFYTTWNIHSLHLLLYREITRFPLYKPYLSQAYHEQLELLKGLENRCPLAIRIALERIRTILRDCNNVGAIQYLKNQLGSLIDKIPELKAEFDRLEFGWKTKATNQGQHRKPLFQGCQNLGDLKKRFRKLALQNHPDHGGSPAAMKEILKQYEESQRRMRL